MQTLNNIKIAKNFNLKEFECPCCKRVKLDNRLLKLLVLLRLMINRPVHINSGYRCSKENKKVKGSEASYHMFGMAADIKVHDKSISDLAEIADRIGFTGIGEYNNFLHLDVRKGKTAWKG